MKRCLILLVAAALAAPAAASASTIHVAPAHQLGYPGFDYLYFAEFETLAYYDAAPGEANRLQIAYEATDAGKSTVTVTDPGAVIQPGNRCVSIDAHTARCTNPVGQEGQFIEATEAHLGDGNDQVHATAVQRASEGGTVVYGGPRTAPPP